MRAIYTNEDNQVTTQADAVRCYEHVTGGVWQAKERPRGGLYGEPVRFAAISKDQGDVRARGSLALTFASL